jgi:ElaB/YqjD/DUF883 family membrane-anchored ribosome-binding protein
MANDIKAVITDGEDLLAAATSASSADFAAARDKFEETLKSVKLALLDVARPGVAKAESTAVAANDYVRGNPWTAIGVASCVGALVGFLAAKR